MSNLKFPIEALKLTLTIISSGNPMSTEGLKSKVNQMDGMQRAITILGEYKHQDEREERKKEKKEKPIPYVKR